MGTVNAATFPAGSLDVRFEEVGNEVLVKGRNPATGVFTNLGTFKTVDGKLKFVRTGSNPNFTHVGPDGKFLCD